jgi:hypothetical protein
VRGVEIFPCNITESDTPNPRAIAQRFFNLLLAHLMLASQFLDDTAQPDNSRDSHAFLL